MPKKDELITLVTTQKLLSLDEAKFKTKRELTELLENNIFVPIKETPNIDSSPTTVPQGQEATGAARDPTPLDPEWSDFVMTHFATDKEVFEGKPTRDGLSRVFQKLMGPIWSVVMDVVKPPTIMDPTSTVRCTIEYDDIWTSRTRRISDVFDVNVQNTPQPWCNASAATAATKAEARVLRKGLGIRVLSKEEDVNTQGVAGDLSDDKRPVSDIAKNAIKNLSSKHNVDLENLLKSLSLPLEIDNLTASDAHKVMAALNNSKKEIPQDLIKETT